ncbi:hypothetical protein F0562_008668 [Nyssa sinensis]|uniref:25S rRNA (uridine-N(3))-methyltransferase BMT5-like domain-containing protein n=1 Tax=Nyssa sinensis TaxID=561372 RepID=A0A5J5A876_9ASTE|nr:hypothetical protein F0562_008668 [Nyssa sinensis]
MVATSLDSIVELIRKYEKAMVNVTELQKRGCKVIRGVDATTMIEHSYLEAQKFDRIVSNFPHVDVVGFESQQNQLRSDIIVYNDRNHNHIKSSGSYYLGLITTEKLASPALLVRCGPVEEEEERVQWDKLSPTSLDVYVVKQRMIRKGHVSNTY